MQEHGNLLYWLTHYKKIGHIIGRIEHNSVECSFTEETDESKYLFLSPENELIDKYEKVWRGIKNEIDSINENKITRSFLLIYFI